MIAGLQKMTLLDFPGKVACTVFLAGCNYRCPYCHNSELFTGKPAEIMTEDEFIAFLASRKGLLDGVCVSGGEPTLCPTLPNLLRQIKELGFAVKLDTNGSRPETVKALVGEGLVDYIAMDIKNSPAMYAKTVGLPDADVAAVEETARFLMESGIDHEFRTSLVDQLHSDSSIQDMGAWLASLSADKPQKLFLQNFVDRDTVLYSGLSAPEEEKAENFARILSAYVKNVTVRNK